MQTIYPTRAQITLLWRTLQGVGADYEKITLMSRESASKLIGEIKEAYNLYSVRPGTPITPQIDNECYLNKREAMRRLIKHYEL